MVGKVVQGPTPFPGFSAKRPYGARERERETGRRENLGTRLFKAQDQKSQFILILFFPTSC